MIRLSYNFAEGYTQPHELWINRFGTDAEIDRWKAEIYPWCREHFGKESLDGRWVDGGFVYSFASKSDAMYFKLKWEANEA